MELVFSASIFRNLYKLTKQAEIPNMLESNPAVNLVWGRGVLVKHKIAFVQGERCTLQQPPRSPVPRRCFFCGLCWGGVMFCASQERQQKLKRNIHQGPIFRGLLQGSLSKGDWVIRYRWGQWGRFVGCRGVGVG